MKQPITIARRDYLKGIIDITNHNSENGLPAFVMVDVLKEVIEQLKALSNSQLARDEAAYRAALQNTSTEPTDNGGDIDGGQTDS